MKINTKELVRCLNPAVPHIWLLVIAGLLWSGIGITLCSIAYSWLSVQPLVTEVVPAVVGIGLAIAAYRLGFSKIAAKNTRRILAYANRVCVFAVQEWKGYLIIAFMMTLGIVLRNSAIPKPYLAVVYITIGGALFISSAHYYYSFYTTTLARKVT